MEWQVLSISLPKTLVRLCYSPEQQLPLQALARYASKERT